MRGAGGHFMAGGDIAAFAKVAELEPQERRVAMRERLAVSAPIFPLIERLAQPVITSVRGAVAGGGMGFFLSCDLAVAASDAKFILSNVKMGLVPDGSSSWHLPRTTGMKVAKQIALLGEPVDAATALQWGLVNWVVPPEEVQAETERIARRLAALSPRALGQAKRLLNTAQANTLADQVMLEGESIGDCAQTEAFPAAVRAFVDKKE